MTVAEAIVAALDDWSKDPQFNLGDKIEWLGEKLLDTVEDWADENGWNYNETTDTWEKVQ